MHCGSANCLWPLITHAQNGAVMPKWGKRKKCAFYLESRDMLRASIFSACWHFSCQAGMSERATQTIEKWSRSQKEGGDSGGKSSCTGTPASKQSLCRVPAPSGGGGGRRKVAFNGSIGSHQTRAMAKGYLETLFHIFTHLCFLSPKQPFTVFGVFLHRFELSSP